MSWILYSKRGLADLEMASMNQRRFRISKSRGDWEVLSGIRHILVPVRPKAGNDNFFSSSPLENAVIFRKGFRKE